MWAIETHKKLDKAVRALVSLDAPLNERLDAAIIVLQPLAEKDFSFQLKKQFRAVTTKIHTYQEGSERAELKTELALEIYQLFKSFVTENGPSNL